MPAAQDIRVRAPSVYVDRDKGLHYLYASVSKRRAGIEGAQGI